MSFEVFLLVLTVFEQLFAGSLELVVAGEEVDAEDFLHGRSLSK